MGHVHNEIIILILPGVNYYVTSSKLLGTPSLIPPSLSPHLVCTLSLSPHWRWPNWPDSCLTLTALTSSTCQYTNSHFQWWRWPLSMVLSLNMLFIVAWPLIMATVMPYFSCFIHFLLVCMFMFPDFVVMCSFFDCLTIFKYVDLFKAYRPL